MRAQASMEYLMTYGWAILIIIVALAALIYLGIFGMAGKAPDICSLPVGLQCTNFKVDTGGAFRATLLNGLGDKIFVTGIACTQEQSNATGEPSWESADVAIDSSAAGQVSAVCRIGDGSPATGKIGDVYRGKLYLKYYFASEGSSSKRIARADLITSMQPPS